VDHRWTESRRSGAPVPSAEERVKIAIECLEEAVHIKDIIDIRRLVGLIQRCPIERIDLGAVAVDNCSDEGLRTAM
jgi:hypothetical protein